MRTRTFLPRPEYPRPDRQRSFLQGVDWLNLNGAWEFRFDPDDDGREKRWFDSDEQHWPDQIIMPFCWESLAAWGEADEYCDSMSDWSTQSPAISPTLSRRKSSEHDRISSD
jgi:hypothetical protein